MNVVRPARSVISSSARCLIASRTPALPCQLFHTSAHRPGRRKSRFRNVKFEQMGLTDPEKLDQYTKKQFPAYTEKEFSLLQKQYTPEQLEAIKAGEEAVDPRDLAIQGRLRDDPYRLPYVDDFAIVHPIIDLKPKVPSAPNENKFLPQKEWIDDYIEKMAESADKRLNDSMGKAVARALRKVKQTNPEEIDFTEEELKELEDNPALRQKYIIDADNMEIPDSLFPQTSEGAKGPTGELEEKWWDDIDKHFYEELTQEFKSDKNPLIPSKVEVWKELESTSGGRSALAPELGKVEGVEGLYNAPKDAADDGLDDTGAFQDIKKVTGMKVRDLLSIMTKILVNRSVSNQTRLGKIRSSSVLCVAGNGDGRLGIGEAKSTDLATASHTARILAIRNLRPVRRYENRTIFGNVEVKISGTVVRLRSRPPGFGLRVSHRIFEMARMAGIHDLSAVTLRSRNPMNTVKAAYKALMNQPNPDEIAIGRGKKLVDVRKVYFGGSVH